MTAIRYRTSAQIKFNIRAYLDREFINAGQYINIGSGHYAVNGQRADILTRQSSNTYESFFNTWVADTDHIGCAGFETVLASGVTIDGIFHARGSLPYKPAIDYNNGRVIFEGTAPSANSTIETIFSSKRTTFAFPESNITNVLFSQIQDNIDVSLDNLPSGVARQLPVVVIDPQRRDSFPWQLGGGQRESQLVVFHIISNDQNDLDQIIDLLQDAQFRKVIQGVDFNLAPQQFTQEGDRASTYVNFTDLQASGSIAWSKIYINEARVIERNVFNQYHRARVDWDVEFYRPPDS